MGCQAQGYYPDHYQVNIDPAFADREADVVAVYQDWADKSGVQLDIIIVNKTCDAGTPECISVHPESLANIQAIDPSTTEDVIGVCFHPNPYTGWANVYVQPTFDLQTLRHESGHSLGLAHVGDTSNHTHSQPLMCALNGCAAEDITQADVCQYNDLRKIQSFSCPE
jgi:hypothetical protein